MNNKLSFFVPPEFEHLNACNDIKVQRQTKENLRILLLEIEIINEELLKSTQMKNEIRFCEYTILKHCALKELEIYKPYYYQDSK